MKNNENNEDKDILLFLWRLIYKNILKWTILWLFFQDIIYIKLLIIDIEKVIMNDNNIDIEIKKNECLINISIMIDLLYNIIIYEKYEIELSFEWIINHLKENHEIKI